MKNSIKHIVKNRISRKGWIWIGILYVCSVVYYSEFFNWSTSFGLAIFIVTVIVSMLMTGYVRLGPRFKFPVREFLFFTILFSLLRHLYILFFLSTHLPEYTLFHYPYRALPSVIFGSGALIFLGYSYAIYEWGLAAREKFASTMNDTPGTVNPNSVNFTSPLPLRCQGKTVYVLPQDIIYVNANSEYVDYNTAEKKYTCFKRLKDVEGELKGFGFLRTHRSYIVNSSFIKSISPNEITLQSGHTIPLSKTYRKKVNMEFPIH